MPPCSNTPALDEGYTVVELAPELPARLSACADHALSITCVRQHLNDLHDRRR